MHSGVLNHPRLYCIARSMNLLYSYSLVRIALVLVARADGAPADYYYAAHNSLHDEVVWQEVRARNVAVRVFSYTVCRQRIVKRSCLLILIVLFLFGVALLLFAFGLALAILSPIIVEYNTLNMWASASSKFCLLRA